MARPWSLEFLKDQHPDLAQEGFDAIAEKPSIRLLKEYARYLVRPRTRRITAKIIVRTVERYIRMLMHVIDSAGNHDRFNFQPYTMGVRWEDVDFCGLHRSEDGSFDIQARITIKWAKGTTLNEGKFKIVRLR